MKKSVKSFLLAIILLQVVFAAGPGARAEGISNETLDLENHYTRKILSAYPDLRFSILVKLKPPRKVDLDLFGGAVELPIADSTPAQRIQYLEIVSAQEVPVKSIAQITGLPLDKLRTIKLEVPSETSSTQVPGPNSSNGATKERTGLYLALLALLGGAAVLTLRRTIVSGAKMISEPLEKAIANTATSSITPSSSGDQEKPRTPDAGATRKPEGFTPAQLQALLAECYWCEQDNEAAALLRAFPAYEAYQKLSFGTEYLRFLKFLDPGSLDFMNDAYFVAPDPRFLEISVSATPQAWLPLASEMRLKKSGITGEAILRLQSGPTLAPEKTSESESSLRNASRARTLKAPLRIHFASIEEESKILDSEFAELQKIELPSLYRLTRLNSTDFLSVLEQMTVPELAQAWIGPANILAEIERRMPERKRVLLVEVKARHTPSRSSPAFRKLMKLTRNYIPSPLSEGEMKEAA